MEFSSSLLLLKLFSMDPLWNIQGVQHTINE